MNIVLHEPEIPANTGNISRTCAATGCALHLIRPLGFEITDARLKRAGLDYWHLLSVDMYDSWDEFCEQNDGMYWFFSTKSAKNYCDAKFSPDDYLIFGKETAGLPEFLHRRYPERFLRIPMVDDARSLNLSNSVAVAVYEALRQNGFSFLDI